MRYTNGTRIECITNDLYSIRKGTIITIILDDMKKIRFVNNVGLGTWTPSFLDSNFKVISKFKENYKIY